VFEEVGSRGATTRRIAAEAGVNEVTLFRLFGSKAALLSAALQTTLRRAPHGALPQTPVDPEAELLTWARDRMRTLLERRDVMRTAMAEMSQCPDMAGPVTQGPVQTARELSAYIRQLQASGTADPSVDPSAAAAMLMGAMFTDVMTRDMMPERFEYAPEDAPALYAGLLLRAIRATPRPDPGDRGAGPRPVQATEERQPS